MLSVLVDSGPAVGEIVVVVELSLRISQALEARMSNKAQSAAAILFTVVLSKVNPSCKIPDRTSWLEGRR